MMTRRSLLFLTAAVPACRGPREASGPLLPSSLEGGWQLASSEPIPAGDVPETVRALGLRRAERYRYLGPEELSVTVYAMSTSAGAFELAQKWRPAEASLAFHQDSYFVVAASPALDRPRLLLVITSLENWLKARR